MRNFFLLLLVATLAIVSVEIYSQEDKTKNTVTDVFSKSESTKTLKDEKVDSAKNWKVNGIVGLNSAMTMLKNWAAGGSNSATFVGFGNVRILYHKNKFAWETFFDTEFGYTYIDKATYSWRKSNDKLNFTTKGGYDVGKNFYVTVLGSFRSQYAKGFDYPNDTTKKYISDILSPSYTDISIGIDWKPNDIFSVYLSPAAGRITTCLDSTLRSKYGVENQKNFRAEFGAMLKGTANYQYKSLKVFSTLTLFTPYTKKFGNTDIDWDMGISYQLMKVLNVSLGTSLKYYDNIKFDNGDGRVIQRIQFKTLIGVGIGYTF